MKDEEDNLSVFISYAWGGALEKRMDQATHCRKSEMEIPSLLGS